MSHTQTNLKGETMFSIGDTTWFKGNEITITTAPYAKFGGTWQDGVDESGKVVTVATPAQRDANAKAHQDDWTRQQSQFAKLAK